MSRLESKWGRNGLLLSTDWMAGILAKVSWYNQCHDFVSVVIIEIIIHWTLFWLAESTIIMSRTLKITGYHVNFARFVLLPGSEEAITWLPFFFSVEYIIKQLLHSVFVISRIIKVSLWVISLKLGLRLISLSLTSIILDITKTECNNCFIIHNNIIVYNFMATC